MEDITAALARRSGFAVLVDLLKVAKHGSGERVFVVEFRWLEDRAVPKGPHNVASPEEVADRATRLRKMDARASDAPWTLAVLGWIAQHP